MHFESSSNTDFQTLLSQLGRYYNANENKLSTVEMSRCFMHLSRQESSALIRLFLSLCPLFPSALSHQEKILDVSPTSGRPGNINETRPCQRSSVPPPASGQNPSLRDDDNDGETSLSHPRSSVSLNENSLTAVIPGQLPDNTVSQLLQTLGHLNTPDLNLPHQSLLWGQGTLDDFSASVPGASTNHPSDLATYWLSSNDDTLNRQRLATCTEITFSANLRLVLEACRTDPNLFLRKVVESKALLPNGQGWKAAIATKQENSDMRDLLSIYHRFECYNIYRHVVEAGFHTGEHWVRDKRQELAKKLCDDFPERFQTLKAATKCLSWVDQGCKYYEWTKVFTQISDLGFLIALPSEIPRSAYTSRCTKEQMNATAARFISLGICGIVNDLKLADLGSHVAQKMKEMTANQDVHTSAGPEPHIELSWTSPPLISSMGTPTEPHLDQRLTSCRTVTMPEDVPMLEDIDICSAFITSVEAPRTYDSTSTPYLDLFVDSELPPFSLHIDDWHQSLDEGEIQVAD